MNNYYKDQFRILEIENLEYFPQVVLYDGQGSKTKFINLNTESIPLLIKQLKKLEQKLKDNKNASK